jgi:peptidyl-prolyl cis-trans isomerase C
MRVEQVSFRVPATAGGQVARVNGVALNRASDGIGAEQLRQRAFTELLRQAAMRDGLLDGADAAPLDGVFSEAAASAIDAWLERALQVPEPSDEACRRHHAAHAGRYRSGELLLVRHILFAVTPGTDVVALRKRAEACLLDVRCHDGSGADVFAQSARALSNCPSGAAGGELGWLKREDCAPEFARELFGGAEVGVLPRLVHSRFGLHVVEVQKREGGVPQPFEAVRGAVEAALRQQAWISALRQCLQVLAGQAVIEGVDLDAAATPLVQ